MVCVSCAGGIATRLKQAKAKPLEEHWTIDGFCIWQPGMSLPGALR
jgi:hypothetical protein